jgi:endonuclease YncB( thermonuclease family)
MCGMPMLCLAGTFPVTGTEPDGDSLRFRPDDPDDWTLVPGQHQVRTNATGAAQLRMDAIDALETHYTPRVAGGHVLHQPRGLAHAAAEELLRELGFTDVERDGERITAATPEEVEGYIVTRFADKYGRPVSLAFAGEPDHPDGTDVFVDIPLLDRSVNRALLAAGLVYPTFYSKLYYDLRGALAEAAEGARLAGAGLWPEDVTTHGTKATLGDLTNRIVLLPKLFRRLADYLTLGSADDPLSGFPAYLATLPDRVLILAEGRLTGFDSIVSVEDDVLRLLQPPVGLVFIET